MKLPEALLRDLRQIVADAAKCSVRDEDGFDDEKPVFGRLLDAAEPMWPGTLASNGRNSRRRWANRKKEVSQ